jgi:hypothetical protein
MAYTLAQLTQAIQDYVQNSEATFVANIPNFIQNVEDLILNSVDLDVFRKNQTASTTAANPYLAKPDDYITPFSMSVTVGGTKQFLLIKEVDLVQEVNSSGAQGVPRYYAPFDSGYFLLGPTPASIYTVELHYLYRPTSLVNSGGATWLSTNASMAMLYGCLVEAYIFMKGEPDVMATYKELFGIALSRLKDLGEAKENTDAYRLGLPLKERT